MNKLQPQIYVEDRVIAKCDGKLVKGRVAKVFEDGRARVTFYAGDKGAVFTRDNIFILRSSNTGRDYTHGSYGKMTAPAVDVAAENDQMLKTELAAI